MEPCKSCPYAHPKKWKLAENWFDLPKHQELVAGLKKATRGGVQACHSKVADMIPRKPSEVCIGHQRVLNRETT